MSRITQQVVYAGGQSRNLQCGCGWSTRGSVREAQKLFLLHRKHCKKCGPLLNPQDFFNQFDRVSFDELYVCFH